MVIGSLSLPFNRVQIAGTPNIPAINTAKMAMGMIRPGDASPANITARKTK